MCFHTWCHKRENNKIINEMKSSRIYPHHWDPFAKNNPLCTYLCKTNLKLWWNYKSLRILSQNHERFLSKLNVICYNLTTYTYNDCNLVCLGKPPHISGIIYESLSVLECTMVFFFKTSFLLSWFFASVHTFLHCTLIIRHGKNFYFQVLI